MVDARRGKDVGFVDIARQSDHAICLAGSVPKITGKKVMVMAKTIAGKYRFRRVANVQSALDLGAYNVSVRAQGASPPDEFRCRWSPRRKLRSDHGGRAPAFT